MATYKVVDAEQLNADMSSVADSIRTKGGTTDALAWPDGYKTAIDSIPSGAAKETWVIKSDAGGEFATTQISFTSNGQKFTSIGANYADLVIILHYDNEEIAGFDPGASAGFEFYNEAYRKLTFDTSPAGALLTWLQSNATKQPDDTAVQDTKALTITSNGTVSVTPDVPYDGLSSVDVTVNVASGGGGGAGYKVTFPATATNWNFVSSADLLISDGSVINFTSYSMVSGQTIENVVGINCIGTDSAFILSITLSGGSVAQYTTGTDPLTSYMITISPDPTFPSYYGGRTTFWWPLADTVISKIEIVDVS